MHQTRIEHLLRVARFAGDLRKAALIRLWTLQRAGLLTCEQKEVFGQALWSTLDQGSPPLPSEMPFRINALRNLPAPQSVDVFALLRQKLFTVSKYMSPDDKAMVEMIDLATTHDPVRPAPSTATALLDNYVQPNPWLRGWLQGSRHGEPHLLERRRNWLGQVIARSLVPAIATDELTIERLNKILDLMDETHCTSAVAALPYFAAAHPGEVVRLLYRVQAAVLGTASDDVIGGADAVRIWLSEEALCACLSPDQIAHLHELLFTALVVSSRLPEFAVVAAMHAVLAKNLDSANADRLTKVTLQLLARTQPDQVQPGTDDEAHFSMVRAELLRMAKTLLNSGLVTSVELQTAVSDSRSDPLPEVRYALAT